MRAGNPSSSFGDDATLSKGPLCEDLGGDLDANDLLQGAPDDDDELLNLAKKSDLASCKGPASPCNLFSKDFNQGACLSPVLEFL
jgi:hypothetical protein